MAAEPTMQCPQCGATLPVDPRYVTWCEECGWNLKAPEPDVLPGRLGRVYAAAGRRLGARLEQELLRDEGLEPRLTPSKIVAYAIAAGVYALTTAFAIGGALLIVVTYFNPIPFVAGVLLIALAWLMRPRFGKPPKDGLVTRAEAPKLYALVDEVARALDTPSIDVLGIDHDWNASWAVLGLPRRRVLTLGLPLWTALEPNERVALLAHELAHERNGDARRGLFVHGAVSALAELYFVLAPGREDPDEPVEFVDAVVGALLWVVSRPLWALLLLEVHLLLRDSQRAEYLADRRAASVAGTDAAVSLAEKMLLAPSLAMVAQRTAHAGDSAGDLFDELAATIGSVPARERERRRRVARLEAARLDATHPPTAKRIELLESRRREPPRVRLDPVRAQFIDEELRALRPKLQRALVADYLDSIYA